jgi:peptide/nickel transport system substrate-binding protein
MTTIARTGGIAFIAALALGPVPSGAAEPIRGGILPFAVAAEPPTYDCHAANTFAVLHRVSPHYSTLLAFESRNYPNIVGDAASEWSVAPDNLTYTFKLRPNIRFHDGTPFTSADVKATYERLRAPPAGIVSIRQPSFEKVDTIETPDPLTIVFRMKEFDSSILVTFASPWNCLYSAARLRDNPNFPQKNVIGTGPFKFVEHVAGSHWTGARFDGYFKPGRPYLDGFRAITMNAGVTLNALEGRQILAEFRGFSPAERDRLVAKLGKAARVQEAGWLLDMILTFNAEKKPFDDARVRRALSLAIDRWGGAKSLGRVSPLSEVGGLVQPSGLWSASEAEMTRWPGYGKNIEANRAEARRLLREAGAENLSFTLSNRNIEPYGTIGIFLIDQWRQIGVKVEHRPLELAAWTSSLYTGGTFDAIVDSFTDFADDPTSALVKYISSDRSPVSAARFTDRTLDDLYDRQARTVAKDERIQLIRTFETRLFDQAYAVPLYWWRRIVVTNARVQGWTMSPSHMIYQDLAEVWLASETE